MMYKISRESRIAVEYDGRIYLYNALVSYNTSTSYEEYKTLRRTIHRKTNYPVSKVVAQSPSALSIQVHLTSSLLETNFFDWMGFSRSSSNDIILPKYSANIEPQMLKIFIQNPDNNCIVFDSCYVASVDFSLAKEVPIFNIGLESGSFYELKGSLSGAQQGDVLPSSPTEVLVNNTLLPGFMSASMSFQQQCSWRENRNIHDIGTIYTNKRAIINELNSSATLQFYYTDKHSSLPDYNLPITIRNNFVSVNFPSARIIKRLDLTDVYQISYDIIPMNNSDPVTLKFSEK